MPAQLNPYLMLGGTARTAMTFYREIFGGHIEMRTYAELPGSAAESADRVMHSTLITDDGLVIMAADSPEDSPVQSNDVAIAVSHSDRDITAAWWDGLCADGTAEIPFAQAPWGHRFGMCVDKFGVRWMVSDLVQ